MDIEIGKLTFHWRIGCVLFNPGLWLHRSISIDVAGIHMCFFLYENTCHFQVIETNTHLAV